MNKLNSVRRMANNTIRTGKHMVCANTPQLRFVTGIATATCSLGIQIWGMNYMSKRQREMAEFYVYDKNIGHRWKLKRLRTVDECIEMSERVEAGESIYSILASMDLIDKHD